MKDLTKGYPAKAIILFAIPLMLGNIFQQLYNMADSKIVSTYIGTDALAAVGATAVIVNTLIVFLNGLTQGFSILVATRFGAKDTKSIRQYVAGTVILTIIITLIITAAGLVYIERILEFLNTPKDILPDALAYIRIIIAGLIFTALYNMFANILRAVGDSKTPLYCLMFALFVNVGLDLLFVSIFSWGMEGAAIATVIAQAISAAMCGLIVLLKFRDILPVGKDWKPFAGQYSGMLAAGFSMALMGCIVNMGTVVLQGSINNLGTDIVVAHTAIRRVFSIMMAFIGAVGTSMTTYASQNMGAGKPLRVRQGMRHAMIISTVLSTALLVGWYIFGEEIVIWLTSTDSRSIIDAAVMYMNTDIWFFYVLGPLFVLRCTLQGMGRKTIPIFSSILELAIKVLFAIILVPAFGYVGVAFTEPVSWIIMIIPLIISYFRLPPEKMLQSENTL